MNNPFGTIHRCTLLLRFCSDDERVGLHCSEHKPTPSAFGGVHH